MAFRMKRAAWLRGALLFLLSGQGASGGEVTIRIMPQTADTRGGVFRLGLRAGLGESTEKLLRAECLTAPATATGATVSVTQTPEPDTGRVSYTVANEGAKPEGVTLTTAPLRKGVGHTLRVTCRPGKGSGVLRFGFIPVDGRPDEATGKRVKVKGGDAPREVALNVTPHRDGSFACAFRIDPGCVMTFSGFSLLPDDALEGWDSQTVEALRLTGAGVLRWSAQGPEGAPPYNWYDGVGPRAARAAKGNGFGTAEASRVCHLIGAEPVFQVPVFRPTEADGRFPDLTTAATLAADWVAYCNATGGHPLALLRTRHGLAEPMDVKRWELVPVGGRQQDAAGLHDARQACAAAMKREDPSIAVEESADAPGTPDAYVARVLARLAAGAEEDRAYFYAWYDALGKIGAELRSAREGAARARVGTPFEVGTVLQRGLYARHRLSGAGWLMSLVNRFPTTGALAAEGGTPGEKTGAFWVQAAWSEDASALVVFVYNAGTEPQKVRLDLTALKRRFAFYASEQVAADITARRTSPTVPVLRRQKAGSAMTQVVLCEAAPSSLTRVLVRE